MSTFNDGSGQEKDSEGNTRLGWRELERVAALMLNGTGGENKNVFDVIVEDTRNPNNYYGVSIKSKELSRTTALGDLGANGRVYIELCNSPAKLWEDLNAINITASDFSNKMNAQAIGDQILKTVSSWHLKSQSEFSKKNKNLDLKNSIFLVISYSKPRKSAKKRTYQIHSFPLEFPKGIIWSYASNRCLRGFEPNSPNEAIFDWYGLSGGQLKYYPKATSSRFSSSVFDLLETEENSLAKKAIKYFPDEWLAAGGNNPFTEEDLISELTKLSKLFKQTEIEEMLLEVIDKIS